MVDEIRRINVFATTTKSRNASTGVSPGEALSKIENLSMPGSIDLKSIISIARDLLGVTHQTISGDLTVKGDDKNLVYVVKIRQSPTNSILVDEEFLGEPEDVIKKIAIKIVEKIDPVVAASFYRNKKNTVDALRMIDAALSNGNDADDVFALSQRAQIYKSQKKFDLSRADLDRLLAIDPKSPQGLGVMSAWFIEQGMFAEGLAYAEKQISVKPDMWYAHYNKAEALEGLNRDALPSYEKGLSLSPTKSYAYVQAAKYFEKINRDEKSEPTLLAGVSKFPSEFDVNFEYGKILVSHGHAQLASHYLKRAYALNPTDKQVSKYLLNLLDASDQLYVEIEKKKTAIR